MSDKYIQAGHYKIHFEDKHFTALHKFLDNHSFSGIVVLTDNSVKKNCLAPLSVIFKQFRIKHIISIRAGEAYKNIDTCRLIWDKLNDFNCDRNSLLINVGGGVISDIGGFCASVYKRGISFINIPTTCLAMADASVGGKTGIDYGPYKNLVGTFAEPEGVFIYSGFCETQSKRGFTNGLAEIIKAGFIADKDLVKDVMDFCKNKQGLSSLLKRSVTIKNTIVEIDPKEKDLRKALNFGHSIGHAIESFYLGTENELLHGEAIAIGMICESYIALKLGLLKEKDFLFIEDAIYALFKKVKLDPKDFHRIEQLMLHDKKNRAGKIRMALVEKPGKPIPDVECPARLVEEALHYYAST